MNLAKFPITGEFLGQVLSLEWQPLSTTLPRDCRIVEVTQGEHGVFWVTAESSEFLSWGDEVPEIEVFYWGGNSEHHRNV